MPLDQSPTILELDRFTAAGTLLHRHTALWAHGTIELEIETWDTKGQIPPQALATSGRCVVLGGRFVLLMTNVDGDHILPGGRLEPGEDLVTATIREVQEEAGIILPHLSPLGLMVYRHLTPMPAAYPYPYPIFTNTIFVCQLGRPHELTLTDDFEQEGRFVSIDAALNRIAPHEQGLLQLARRYPLGR